MDTRLRGPLLRFVQALLGAVAVLCLVDYVSGIPLAFAQLHTVCTAANCPLTPSNVQELRSIGLSVGFFAAYSLALALIFVVVTYTVGVVVFWRKPDDRMALFASLALVTFAEVPFSGLLAYPVAGAPLWKGLSVWVTFLGETAPVIFFYLFPDGRFVPRWTRELAALLIVLELCGAFFPDSLLFHVLLPYRLEVYAAFLTAALFAQFYRYWRVSGPVQRQQTKWVVFGIAVAVGVSRGVIVMLLLLGSPSAILALIGNTVFYLSLLLIPLSIGLAILHYHLWDIDVIINRTLVYAILSTSIVGIYVLAVFALGILFQARSNLFISLLATGLVAVLFQPLRQRLQHAVNRLIYGERDDPYRVIARLGQRVEGTLAPDAVLPTIVETVAQALKLPYAAIAVEQEEHLTIAASYGESKQSEDDRAPLLHLPLVYQAEQVGELVLAPRAAGETFTSADRRLLEDLAHQIGVAVHAVQLTADLQRLTVDLQQSRERLVIAREEERRRLRRDLHDGIGPTLASLFQRLDTALRLVPHDPDGAVLLLQSLKGQVKATITEIRRVVYALRPPVLDELGLVSALREHTAYAQASNGLRVSIEAPEAMPKLSAAVEVAAYRIVLEALTNVERHAQAHTCLVRLELAEAGDLCLEITDDGVGLSAHAAAGVGLASMRERAAELGGVCKITSDPTRGTRVWVKLPLVKEERNGTDPPVDRR